MLLFQTSFIGLSTWTESLGLGPRPLTREDAIAGGWKRTNEKCNDSDRYDDVTVKDE